MLNKNNERELCYVVIIDNITPIEGYDRVELAHVSGWTIVVGKGEFEPGDPAIYFEIDSKLPEVKPFTDMEFLTKKKYKIKTQKMCKSISQGLLMSAKNFGWEIQIEPLGGVRTPVIIDKDGKPHYPNDESRFLTAALGVTYAERKKLLFIFFGKKKDKRGWPEWVQKTDEERIQNMPWILEDKNEWIATEKIDGTSTTFTLKRKPHNKYEFLVCSRNVCFDKPDKNCYYETNVYTEMAEKYNIEAKMKEMMRNFFDDSDWITIQGETYGPGIQKRDYSVPEHNFMAFNLISSKNGRWNTETMKGILENVYGIPCVPIINKHFILPDTVDELLDYATGKSVIDGEMREGIVFRYKDGSKSFKAVSNEYLLKFHQ